MRVLSALAAVPLLVLLLTWLSLRSANTDAEMFDRVLVELDRFKTMEAALHRDVLSARAGVLRNYDPLVREANDLQASLGRLREAASVDVEAAVLIDHLAEAVARQEDLVEQFKSNNALLQNSLSYFGLFTSRLGADDKAGAVSPAVSALTGAMLRLTLDTSPATIQAVRDRLKELAGQTSAPEQAEATQALLAHGHLLSELLPATDRVLKALSTGPAYPDVKALGTAVLADQAMSRMTARRFRLVLYVTSLLLLGLLAQFGLRLRARALVLQRRAALEHVIAGISMRLLTAQSEDIGPAIGCALGDLALCLGADRAYFLLSCASSRTQTWCGPGVTFPPGWPDDAPALAARSEQTRDGLIHVPYVNRLPPGEEKTRCMALGLRGWAYMSILREDDGVAALGFDAVGRRSRIAQPGELGLVRMALDTIVNAIRQEQLESERSRLEARVQQAHRMETVGALASGIAHNFNNILGAIMGYAEMTEAAVASNSVAARNLGEIRRAGERARVLVDQLLTFGRRGDARRRPVDMRDLIADSTSLLAASLPAGIEVAVRPVPDRIVVAGEHAQLEQVILNLCNNAGQAMDGVGRIDIGVDVQQLTTARSLSHGDLVPGRYVRLAVDDTGRGMDGPTMARVFEPFFTTRVAGNGLGLATVREIVREHDGAMHVVSTPNVGSRFEAWLPCAIAAGVAPDKELRALPSEAGKTVLLIDDDRERLLRTEELLAALGYEPVGFTSPPNALRACREAPTRFDLLVIGYCPSALEVAAALHEHLPGLPILLAAASADGLATDTLVTAGISDVVHLPFSASEIAAALERWLVVDPVGAGPQGRAERQPDAAFDGR